MTRHRALPDKQGLLTRGGGRSWQRLVAALLLLGVSSLAQQSDLTHLGLDGLMDLTSPALSVVAQNLVDRDLEFLDNSGTLRSTMVKRSAYAKLTWQF